MRIQDASIMMIILIIGLIGAFYVGSHSASSTIGTGQQSIIGGAPAPTTTVAAGCGYQPTVAVTGLDALVASTAATPTTVNYIENGVYRGTSAPAVVQGSKWTIIGDLAGYLADEQSITVQCGANSIITKGYAYTNATVTIKDDPVTSSNTLTNGGGANNATKAAAGGYRQFPMIFQGATQKSTGKIFMIVETAASMGTNTSSIVMTLNGQQLSPASIPNGITASNAASYRTAFEIPAIVGASSSTGTLTITNTATGVVTGLTKVTFYAEQKFVNADGKVEEGIMDSTVNGNNAAKYQDSYTYNFVIQ